jgi:hypothetical protein
MSILKNKRQKSIDSWVYARALSGSNSHLLNISRILLRFINTLILFPKVLFTKNSFEFITISGGLGMKKCLVCTKNNNRILNIHKNTLQGFHVLDVQINRKICAPNFKRAMLIIQKSINYSNYSIIKIAEIYDFSRCENLLIDFCFFASSDGSTPLARTMCHMFTTLKKRTFRIVTHAYGPKPQKNFNYNFLTENYKGKVDKGWVIVKGSPWKEKVTNKAKFGNIVGIIGEPSGIRLLGIEYWMLILAYKLKKNNLMIKIRLHPQSYNFSNYLINKIFNIETSNSESEEDFISSCACLISSYRSTLIDLALSSGVAVILDKQKDQLSIENSSQKVEFISLRNGDQKIVDYIGCKADSHDFISQSNRNTYPSIKDIVT